MMEEEGTIIIEVTNDNWPVDDETSYQQYRVSVQCEEVPGGTGEPISSYIDSEEVNTHMPRDGIESNTQVVTNEKTSSKNDCDGQGEVVESSELHESTICIESHNEASEEQAEDEITTCPYCLMNFSPLQTHLWIHPEYKPFKCQVCGRTFRSQVETDEHSRRHFYNKNYFCRMCGLSVSCKVSCIKHIRKVHGTDDKYVNMFMLKEVPSNGKMMLAIRTVRDGKIYKRKFAMIKE